jgi:hypothetical protein
MNLEIPDGAQVQVIIGKAPLLALPDGTEAERPKSSPGRPILMAAIAVLLLAGAFTAGRLVAARGAYTGVASATEAVPDPPPPPVRQAFPEHALTGPPAGNDAGQVPEAFQRELQQQPTVVPPPGQPATPPPTAGKSAFGLEN